MPSEQRKKLVLLLGLFATAGLQGCMYPGKQDLEAQGVSGSVVVAGNYKKIANCVVEAGENEEYELGELQAIANIYREKEDQRKVEIGNAFSSGSVYLWLAEFTQQENGKVLVEVTARKDGFLGARSSDYWVKKIKNFALGCQG